MNERMGNKNLPGSFLLRRKRLIRRVFWLALAAAGLAALVLLAVFLFRYQFYTGYRDALAGRGYTTEEGAPFTPLAEEAPSVPGMQLAAENEHFKLYTDPAIAEVAVYDKRNGVTVYSNPPGLEEDPIANETNRNYLHSQFLLDYFNASRTAGVYDSYSMSVARGQAEAQAIQGGVRYRYVLGEQAEIEYYVPTALSQEMFERLVAALPQADADTLRRMYTLNLETEGLYGLIFTVRTNRRTLRSLDGIFKSAGFTQEDYYAQTALGTADAAEPMTFVIVLEYRLCAEGLEVSMPVSLMEEHGGGFIYRVQLLRAFGAADAREQGYFVVPSGAGALIRFNNGKTTAAAYAQYLYDIDRMDSTYTVLENSVPARLPVFGVCRENSSVLATVERGASLCLLTADVAGKYNSYNTIYPSFLIRSYDILDMFGVSGTEATLPIMEKDLYNENITVRYALLTGEHKGYVGLADYYRERLLAEGALTAQEPGGDLPFFCDVIGGVKAAAHTLGFRTLQVTPMTTFAQAAAMAETLAALGVHRQQMNFQGWMNGGYYHDVPDRVQVLSKLGGKAGLAALSSTLETLGGTLYADTALQNVTLISKRYSRAYESARYYGAGYVAILGQVNPAILRRVSALGYEETLYSLVSPKFLPRYVNGLIRAAESLNLSGVSLRDLGDQLHSDKRRTEVISREEALQVVTAQFDKLAATGRKLLVSGGNLYALPYAQAVTGAPLTSNAFLIVDEEIPLYPMVVHGCADYAGEQWNLAMAADPRRELLRLIEYGASCRFAFTWEDSARMQYTGLSRYYSTAFDNWKETAAAMYGELNAALKPVQGVQMTDHARIGDVTKVTYQNGVVIYVNYGAEDAVLDGFSIPAMGTRTEVPAP